MKWTLGSPEISVSSAYIFRRRVLSSLIKKRFQLQSHWNSGGLMFISFISKRYFYWEQYLTSLHQKSIQNKAEMLWKINHARIKIFFWHNDAIFTWKNREDFQINTLCVCFFKQKNLIILISSELAHILFF